MYENDIKNILQAVDNLQDYIKKLEKEKQKLQTRDQRQCDFYTHRIVKSICRLIASGLCEKDAIALTADEYAGKLKEAHVKHLWNQSKQYKTAINMYARAFMCKKMKQTGFTIAEIALTIGLSQTMVHKILKNDCCIL